MPATLIDVHAHVVPGVFPGAPRGCSCWPRLAHDPGGRGTVYMGDKPFRELDARSWDYRARLASMDEEGVAIQVLSPMPELLSYWMDTRDALALARHVNGFLGELLVAGAGRFHGLGMVPLQDPALAARELARLRDDGFRGVEVGSNINGVLPGDARFDEFLAEAERLGMALFVHALHPVGAERLAATPELVPFAAFPLDTALAAASLIRAGVLERHPRLRIGFSHGGGALVSLVPRLQRGWELSGGFGGASHESPAWHAQRFYYDSLVYDAAWLRHLMTDFAPGQFFAGTDYPYVIEQTGLRAFLADATRGADDPVFAATARRFLGLDARSP